MRITGNTPARKDQRLLWCSCFIFPINQQTCGQKMKLWGPSKSRAQMKACTFVDLLQKCTHTHTHTQIICSTRISITQGLSFFCRSWCCQHLARKSHKWQRSLLLYHVFYVFSEPLHKIWCNKVNWSSSFSYSANIFEQLLCQTLTKGKVLVAQS